jgi:predicted GNAT family acetyltransferase
VYADKTAKIRKLVEKVPKPLRGMLDVPLILALRSTRRNVLVFEKGGDIMAHVAFHRHGKTMHMFHVWVNHSLRNKGYAREAVADFIEFARKKGMKSVRLGEGNNDAVNRIWEYCARHADEYNVRPRKGYWLDLI